MRFRMRPLSVFDNFTESKNKANFEACQNLEHFHVVVYFIYYWEKRKYTELLIDMNAVF